VRPYPRGVASDESLGVRHAAAKERVMLEKPARKFAAAVGGIVILTVAGTIGYMLIEDYRLADAVYMTVITLSTVGFAEVRPLSEAGRMFTVGLIVTGVGSALYLFALIGQMVFEGTLRDALGATAMQRKIHKLSAHVIVCGFGRFGRVVVEELLRHSVPCVVIDPDASKGAELDRIGAPHLAGSALEDEVLEEAGVRTARAIVVATGSDADNVYITLSAREKNQKIGIHARAESDGGIRRLRLAGANQVVSAYQRGGHRIAETILRPSVVDFLELAMPGRGDEVDLEEIRIGAESPLVGRGIEAIERDTPRLRIVALKRGNDPIVLIPDPKSEVRAGDHLVAIGDRASLRRFAEIVKP